MRSEPVVIVDHDARWCDAFERAAAELHDVLGRWVVEIEHIGSTAVVYFRRRSPVGVPTHHVHLVERADHGWWERPIRFRDWLRARPEDRDRYAMLKRSLAAEHRNDRNGYTEGKSAFIASFV